MSLDRSREEGGAEESGGPTSPGLSEVKPNSPAAPSPRGVEHAGVIDQLVHDPRTGVVLLIMVEARPWDGSELRLYQLQEKLNAYLSFALDGEMAEDYPQLIGLPLRLRLACATYPESAVVDLLERVREQIAFQGIDLEVVVQPG